MATPYSREYWKELLPVITAFVEGKEIEMRCLGEWNKDDGSGFSFSNGFSYRIKPAEPFRLNTLAEQVELLKHKLGGGTLECRLSYDSGDKWYTSLQPIPSFNGHVQYRIAKEPSQNGEVKNERSEFQPLECWVNVWHSLSTTAHASAADAREEATGSIHPFRTAVHMREVI